VSARVAELDVLVRERDASLRALKRSWAWRLSAPLRWLGLGEGKWRMKGDE
jgi:hypothetical protein